MRARVPHKPLQFRFESSPVPRLVTGEPFRRAHLEEGSNGLTKALLEDPLDELSRLSPFGVREPVGLIQHEDEPVGLARYLLYQCQLFARDRRFGPQDDQSNIDVRHEVASHLRTS
jgi:hypothetical protein